MKKEDAEKLVSEIKKFHSKTISPLMNGSKLTSGSSYSFSPPVENVNKVEFVTFADKTGKKLSGKDSREEGFRWSMKAYPSQGGEPFRIEEHPGQAYAHVNTANEEYNHVRLKIPDEYLKTHGAVGSAASGYYVTQEANKDIPELIKIHWDEIERNRED